MGNQNTKGLVRLVNATRYSWQGIRAAWVNEEAFRQESVLALILLPLGLWLGETGVEKAMLAAVVLIVLMVELLNTGIEFVVDRFGKELHEYCGIAKDVASAAVFLSLVNVLLVWLLVLCF